MCGPKAIRQVITGIVETRYHQHSAQICLFGLRGSQLLDLGRCSDRRDASAVDGQGLYVELSRIRGENSAIRQEKIRTLSPRPATYQQGE